MPVTAGLVALAADSAARIKIVAGGSVAGQSQDKLTIRVVTQRPRIRPDAAGKDAMGAERNATGQPLTAVRIP